ncbi:polyprenyl diphosphate synthase [Acidocella sp.]|uniref:polyprenyl diphosphate synthase n=1 Tax=Acidocella sp. TaxID=50710 RepID=UPI0026396622|nr:polyprenyl diphosphate synthase [Acidocella sp.]
MSPSCAVKPAKPTSARGGGLALARRGLRRISGPLWRLVYGFYERQLEQQVRARPMPGHIGIILDGNRRHARESGLSDPEAIYRLGAAKLDDILAWSAELGVRMVTLWVFSPDNLRRPEMEVGGIFGAVEAKMRALAADPHIQRRGVHIAAMGRRDLLPPALLEAIDAAEAATRGNDQITVTLAIGYGGREEIADAMRAFLADCAARGLSTAEAALQVTPEAIRQHLYLAGLPDPDLIIRTSGEVRLSGFMLWQSVHSELYFCDVNWPVMRRIDYLRAIRAFQRRDRRFGG